MGQSSRNGPPSTQPCLPPPLMGTLLNEDLFAVMADQTWIPAGDRIGGLITQFGIVKRQIMQYLAK